MPTVAEVINHLKTYKPSEHIATAIWGEDDVLERAKELHIKCNRKEAQDILDQMDSKQDCSIGISWDTIDDYLHDLKDEREIGRCPACGLLKTLCICQKTE